LTSNPYAASVLQTGGVRGIWSCRFLI
jgi:hypothetical protein